MGDLHLNNDCLDSDYFEAIYDSAPSAPRNLHMVRHDARTVRLQWEIPAQTNGDIRTYQVHYRAKFLQQGMKLAIFLF